MPDLECTSIAEYECDATKHKGRNGRSKQEVHALIKAFNRPLGIKVGEVTQACTYKHGKGQEH